MRNLIAIVRADFLREFSRPSALIFFLVLPLVFTATVSAGLSGMMGGAETPSEISVPVAAVFNDTGTLVDLFVAALETNRLELRPAATLPPEGFGLVIPEDFAAEVLRGGSPTLLLQVDGTDNRNVAVQQAVDAALRQFGGAGVVARAGTEELAPHASFPTAAAQDAFTVQLLVEVIGVLEQPPVVTETAWASYVSDEALATNTQQASAGQLVTWVQITLLATSAVLVNERVNGTLQRLVVMPTARATILSGKVMARLLLGLLQMALLFLSGVWLFNVSWGQDWWAVIAVSLAFALAVTGLGLLLATLVKTPGQAGSATTGLAMFLAAIGGAWWPLEVTPPFYQQVVQVFPTTWAMRAYTRILAQGVGVQALGLELGILSGFALLFFVWGVIRFNRMAVT